MICTEDYQEPTASRCVDYEQLRCALKLSRTIHHLLIASATITYVFLARNYLFSLGNSLATQLRTRRIHTFKKRATTNIITLSSQIGTPSLTWSRLPVPRNIIRLLEIGTRSVDEKELETINSTWSVASIYAWPVEGKSRTKAS